jgi:hypothetical protein
MQAGHWLPRMASASAAPHCGHWRGPSVAGMMLAACMSIGTFYKEENRPSDYMIIITADNYPLRTENK